MTDTQAISDAMIQVRNVQADDQAFKIAKEMERHLIHELIKLPNFRAWTSRNRFDVDVLGPTCELQKGFKNEAIDVR